MTGPRSGRRVATTTLQVRSYELDAYGHVNHSVHLNYLEHARFEVLRDCGLPPEALSARGLGVHVVRIEVDYRKQLRLGDRLIIETWVEEMRASSMTLVQRMYRDEDPLVAVTDGRVVAVWVGPRGRPTRIPPDVRAAFDTVLAT